MPNQPNISLSKLSVQLAGLSVEEYTGTVGLHMYTCYSYTEPSVLQATV